MLRQKTPYWEQSDSCHSLSTSELFKSNLKSPKAPKGKAPTSQKPKAVKKWDQTENVQPEDDGLSQLMRSTMRLKEYKLPDKYQVANVKYMDTTGKTVFNDFHSKQTNPGYSRNNLGGFYTK